MHLCTRDTQRAKTEQQERQAKEEVANVAVFFLIDKDDAKEESWIDGARDVERHTG